MKSAALWLLCAVAGFDRRFDNGAEIKVLSAGAVEPGLRAAAGAYTKQSGNPVNITFNTAPEIRKRVAAGEVFDVVIAPPAALEEFAGKVSSDRAGLGRVGLGVAVRPGADVPDISSTGRPQALGARRRLDRFQPRLDRDLSREPAQEAGRLRQDRIEDDALPRRRAVMEHVLKGKARKIAVAGPTSFSPFLVQELGDRAETDLLALAFNTCSMTAPASG